MTMPAAILSPAPRLADVLAGASPAPGASGEVRVQGITLDSRRVRPGWAFFAVPGSRDDGRDYIAAAVRNGAAAIVCEAGPALPAVPVPVVAVSGLRGQLGAIADRYFGEPSAHLCTIGITGTNGKTTCAHLLAQALERNRARCGLIGTLGNGFPGRLTGAGNTTPDVFTVHAELARFDGAGARYACVEATSHALEQGRVQGVRFAAALFTNLTQDHLDYHGDLARYARAKARLFDAPGLAVAVINAEDAFGAELIERLRPRLRVVSYGIDRGDVRALSVDAREDGLGLRVVTPRATVSIDSPLIGRFNAANLVGSLAVLHALGMPDADAAQWLSAANAVPGRMERCSPTGAAAVIVDYAHTPDALEKALSAVREHARGAVWCVFGCGGDRDRGKRPLMGRVAERLADHVVLTDDNPRHERPQEIVADILEGMQRPVAVIHDRAAAIRHAVERAVPGDVVLVAGKGHEDTQQTGDTTRAFSDRDVVRALTEGAR